MITLEYVERALKLPDFDASRAQRQMAPKPRSLYRPPETLGHPRRGGVLMLLYPVAGRLKFALTRRTDQVANHQGQISLPGGGQEPGESLMETAFRETDEELGVNLDGNRLLGQLKSLYIPPSDFEIHPFVAFCHTRPAFSPSPAEVAELLEVPADCLLDPELHQNEDWMIQGYSVEIPFYFLGGYKVWGATAMVLSEMEHRLQSAMGQPYMSSA